MQILAQPDDTTCGPTCLHAVYAHFGDDVALEQIIRDIPSLPNGGSLAADLGCDALRRGYEAQLYTYNLAVFDPTWFERAEELPEKLEAQAVVKTGGVIGRVTSSYLTFLELGGEVLYRELTGALLEELLSNGDPVLTGLNSTYLYHCAREWNDNYDDLRGVPAGHFVLIYAHDDDRRRFAIADPFPDNPAYRSRRYEVDVDHLIGAIMLGIVSNDANLLVIRPTDAAPAATAR